MPLSAHFLSQMDLWCPGKITKAFEAMGNERFVTGLAFPVDAVDSSITVVQPSNQDGWMQEYLPDDPHRNDHPNTLFGNLRAAIGSPHRTSLLDLFPHLLDAAGLLVSPPESAACDEPRENLLVQKQKRRQQVAEHRHSIRHRASRLIQVLNRLATRANCNTPLAHLTKHAAGFQLFSSRNSTGTEHAGVLQQATHVVAFFHHHFMLHPVR